MTRHHKVAKNLKKHNHICDLVEEELQRRGWTTTQDIVYNNIKSGQLDVAGFKNKYAMVVEVKYNDCNRNHLHACEQTERAVNYCPELQSKRVFRMYGYHQDKGYVLKFLTKKLYY